VIYKLIGIYLVGYKHTQYFRPLVAGHIALPPSIIPPRYYPWLRALTKLAAYRGLDCVPIYIYIYTYTMVYCSTYIGYSYRYYRMQVSQGTRLKSSIACAADVMRCVRSIDYLSTRKR